MSAKEFQLVMSLGGLCQVAFQIETHFGFRISSPFDWIVTPLEAVGRVLTDDGAGFGTSVWARQGRMAICDAYGVSYAHDYPRSPDGMVHVTADLLTASRHKMLHKYRKMLDALSHNPRTLFVRLAGHHDDAMMAPCIADPRPLTTEDLNSFCAAIAARFPTLDFEIAFAYLDGFTRFEAEQHRLDPRLKVFRMTDDPASGWKGRTENWTPLFQSFAIRIDPRFDIARQYVGATIDGERLL